MQTQHHFRKVSSMTPSPNKAKSYLTGSSGSNFLSCVVNSTAVCQSVCFLVTRPSLRATRSTCTSHGHIRRDGETERHNPKSTPLSSLRTIHRRNMFSRLHVDLFNGVEMCLRVRCG